MNKHKKTAEQERLDCIAKNRDTADKLNSQYKVLHPVFKAIVLVLLSPLAPIGYALMALKKHKGGSDE